MKKILSFLLFALCLTVAANAQLLTLDFEAGTIPSDFTNVQNNENYAWIVIDTTDESGNTVRCIRSGNRGVASSTSAIEITLDIAADWYITFDALCMGEGTNTAWDKCIFYIDGEAQFTYGAHIAGWNHYAYNVSAGSHTFKWVYKKDSSVNPTGDAFFVDNISFGLGTLITEINIIGFTKPAWGEHPDYEVSVPDDAPYTLGYVEWGWIDNSNPNNYGILPETGFFNNEDYSYYMGFIFVLPDGYLFSNNVTVTVNGEESIIDDDDNSNFGNQFIAVTKKYTVEAEPACVISEINIEGFTVPEWGANPDYTVDVPADANYTVNYTDWNWWSENLDNGDILLASESFDNEEYTYYMYFEILPNEGCSFADNVTFTVNGEAEDNVIETSGLSDNGYYWAYTYDYTVTEPTTEPCVISEINIEGFTAPEWGANPDYTVDVPADANYTVNYTDWNWWSENLDNGDILLASESFDNEEYTYYMYFEILPNEGCSFADNVTFTVNGEAEDNVIETSGLSDNGYYWAYTYDYTVTEPTTEPCAAPTNLTATNITHNDATLGWTDNNNADVWYIDMDEYGDGEWADYASGDVYSNSFSFHDYFDLTPGKTYRYRVQSICSDENRSDFSEYYLFTTTEETEEPCETPTGLVVSDITGNSATVNWDPSDAENYDLRYYKSLDELENESWQYYDNGNNEDAIGTNGGNFWWGVMFPGGTYSSSTTATVLHVQAYDYMSMNGTVTLYNGGDYAPANPVGTTNVTFTESEEFVEFTFDEPVGIDPSNNLWVVFYNESGAPHPAAVCANTGNPNGRWVSLDGSTWEDLYDYELDYTFMIRAGIFDVDVNELSWTEIDGIEDNTSALTGLAANTDYKVQVRANCEDGESAWSDPVEFTTEAEPTCVINEVNVIGYEPPVAGENSQDHMNITVQDNNANYFLVEEMFSPEWWDEDADEYFNGTFVGGTHYSIGVKIHANDGCVFANNCTFLFDGDENLVNPEYTGVDGEDNTTAYIWTMPELATGTTSPCETPTGLAASNITATTAKLEWTGSQDQYTVRYKEDAASDWTTATTTNRFFPLTGLTPATTYTAQVQGDCGTGAKSVTDWSEPVTFTTLSGTIEPGECGPAVDCEGTSYPTVKIGDVCWMAKNLAAETCVTTGNVYAYVNDQFPDEDANVETYGLLYDEEAAFATGLCPEGYTLPTTEQFEYLKNNFTVEELRNSTGWVVNTGTNGTGFSWDGSGFYNGTSDNFEHMLMEGYLWAVDMTSGTPQPAMYKMMYYCNEIVRVYDFNGISASIRCVKAPETFKCGVSTVKDHENNEYGTVKIGNQCWTKENMRCTTSPSTGTYIVNNTTNEYTYTGKMAKWYNNDSVAAVTAGYGLLYNWNAAMDVYSSSFGETSINTDYENAVDTIFTGPVRGICPNGWHIPTMDEWTELTTSVSSQSEFVCHDVDSYIAKALASGTGWTPYNVECAPGGDQNEFTNASGFGAVPTGVFLGNGFSEAGKCAYFWSATQYHLARAEHWNLYYSSPIVDSSLANKYCGNPVRCLRDSEE